MSESNEFQRYLEELTGVPVCSTPLPESELAKLPLFLRGLYELRVAELFGRRWVLALPRSAPNAETVPSEQMQQLEQLRNRLELPVVLVLAWLTPYLRKQLMRRGVPFMVPGRQIFLPLVWIDLRERFPRAAAQLSARLSVAAQVVVLYHLLREPVNGLSLRELAGKLGYSAMTLSKVADELAASELCRVETRGRCRTLQFEAPPRELWAKARPYLRSPVSNRYWVTWAEPPIAARVAGLTALARMTLIADEPKPIYAIHVRAFRDLREREQLHLCPGPEEAMAQVECWAYDPLLLGDARIVDRLSLALSLADCPDERVQKALREAEAGVW